MIAAATEQLLDLAQTHPALLSEILPHLHGFDESRRQRIWSMLEACAVASMTDEDKLILCEGLRTYLYRRSLSTKETTDTSVAERVETLLRVMQPEDSVLRHRWLFKASWIDLPGPRAYNYEAQSDKIEGLRSTAIQEILDSGGFADLSRLIDDSAAPYTVGPTLASLTLPDLDVVGWMLSHADNWSPMQPMGTAVAAFLHALTPDRREAVVRQTLIRLPRPEDTSHQLELLLLCPCDRTTWAVVATAGNHLPSLYWTRARPMGHYRDLEELGEVVTNLLDVSRPRSAFQCLCSSLESADAGQLLTVLDGIRRGDEPDGPPPDGWHVGRALDQVETVGIASRRQLALVEFALYPLLQDSQRNAKALMHELAANPATFTELICLVFKPESGSEEILDEMARVSAERAFEVLDGFNYLPGTRDDGTVDLVLLEAWVMEVRRLCATADRATNADYRIGYLLAHAPIGVDGIWPCEATREILQHLGTYALLDGFDTGTFNKRGGTSRNIFEGGDQERNLAARYQGWAEVLAVSHPVVATVLDRLARSYINDARREDLDARLRIERS
jgi:hypothetical protein